MMNRSTLKVEIEGFGKKIEYKGVSQIDRMLEKM